MNRIHFSDIVRFILLGGFAASIAIVCVVYIMQIEVSQVVRVFMPFLQQEPVDVAIDSDAARYQLTIPTSVITFGVVIALVLFYFLGIILQAIRIALTKWVERFASRHNAMPFRVLLPFYYYSYDGFTLCIRANKQAYKGDYPEWIYLSDNPVRLIDIVAALVDEKSSTDKEDDSTNRYINETLVSLALTNQIFITVFIIWGFVQGCVYGYIDMRLLTVTTILVAATWLLYVLARAYAIAWIQELYHKCSAKFFDNDKQFHRLLLNQGLPTAFIGIRFHNHDHSLTYLTDCLTSVAEQNYLNIRVLILHDRPEQESAAQQQASSEAMAIINQFNAKADSPLRGKISYVKKECGSPAASLMELRKQFDKISEHDDIFTLLDHDDRLHGKDAILNIVSAMSRNNADICLTAFETIDNGGLDITNNGGKTHNDIVKLLESKSATFAAIKPFNLNCNHSAIFMASSIGWTKSYRQGALNAFMALLADRDPRYEQFVSLRAYEDFPDFLALCLLNEHKKPIRITGVATPTHYYYKHPGSVTSTPARKDFQEYRAGYLAYTIEKAIANAGTRIERRASADTMRYVIFKTLQISNIIAKYKNDNSRTKPEYTSQPYPEFASIDPIVFFVGALVSKINNKKGVTEVLKNNLGATADDLFICILQAMQTIYNDHKQANLIDISELSLAYNVDNGDIGHIISRCMTQYAPDV